MSEASSDELSQDEPSADAPEQQVAGYLVVYTPKGLIRHMAAHRSHGAADPRYEVHLVRSHAALGLADAWRYRGVERDAVQRAVDLSEELVAEEAEVLELHLESLRQRARGELELTPEQEQACEEAVRYFEAEGPEFPDGDDRYAVLADCWQEYQRDVGTPPGRHAFGSDPEAQTLMADLLARPGHWIFPDFDPDLLPDLEMARAVHAACRQPEEREIVRIARPEHVKPHTLLGYDVGTWEECRVSAVRDCLIRPWRHPPPEEALEPLRKIAAVLNEHMLFGSLSDAQAFAAWYREQTWAEDASDEASFEPIAVEAVDPS